MKNKHDVLEDLLSGKETRCCGNCANFILHKSNVFFDIMDGKCKLVNDKKLAFCFDFELCDEYIEEKLEKSEEIVKTGK